LSWPMSGMTFGNPRLAKNVRGLRLLLGGARVGGGSIFTFCGEVVWDYYECDQGS
jgi:hypothetical protein